MLGRELYWTVFTVGLTAGREMMALVVLVVVELDARGLQVAANTRKCFIRTLNLNKNTWVGTLGI